MSEVFEQSRFNLNLLTEENKDATNLRFFEVPASNGLLLTERNKHAESLLTDGIDCVMFSSANELISKLQSSLDFVSLTKNGYNKITQSNYEFTNIVDSIIEYLDKLSISNDK